jgi:hypothetical protein
MRRYVWVVLAVVAFIAAGGFVRAHMGRSRTASENGKASSASHESPTCPLGWLMNLCHGCDSR